jgi:Na+/H+ antiporter NhaB
MEQQPLRNPAPRFYKVAAIAFLLISGVLFWAAVTRHGWMLWAMAALTLLNAIMSLLKSLVPGGQNTNG